MKRLRSLPSLSGSGITGVPLPLLARLARVVWLAAAIGLLILAGSPVRATTEPARLSNAELNRLAEIGGTWLVLNEFLAANRTTNLDPDFNESGDWVELANPTTVTLALDAYCLSDTPDDPQRWAFPPGFSIPPGGYLLVWLDGRDVAATALHANFRISSSGEFVVLYDKTLGQVIDSVEFGQQWTDVSMARIPDMGGTWSPTEQPTPGAPNVLVLSGPPPEFSMPSGIYPEAITLTIAAPGAEAIRYTVDGREPTPTSALYSGPLTISEYTPLRARAFYPERAPSDITTASYFIGGETDRRIPVVDLVLPPEDLFDPYVGIYTNYSQRGMEWERRAHVAVIPQEGGSVEEADAGLRIHGGYSRGAPKKSLRLYFRADYGQSEWSLSWLQRMPVDSFQQLVLRSGANDSFLVSVLSQRNQVTYLRDQLMRDWYTRVGQRAGDGFFVALCLNGQYWGLYNICERVDDNFMETTFGGSDWDIVKGTWTYTQKFYPEAIDGDLNAWYEFLAWVDSHDLSTPADFAELKNRMDYDNFLDYFVLNIFAQNEDWPHNNWIATRRRDDPTAKWSFHEWDSEWALGLRPNGYQSDTLAWAQLPYFYVRDNGGVAPLSRIFNGILANPEGRRDFIARMEEYLNFEFRPDRTTPDFETYVDAIESEVPREATRWDSASPDTSGTLLNRWYNGVSNVRVFLAQRPAFIRQLFVNSLALGGVQDITLQSAGTGTGRAAVNGRIVDLPWTGTFFRGSQVRLQALPFPGSVFVDWSGDFPSTLPVLEYRVDEVAARTAVVTFEGRADAPSPNDVIFNEYWVNDDGTPYRSIEGRGIQGDWIELLVVKPGTDLRGWRVSNNPTVTQPDPADPDTGSLILPRIEALSNVASGTLLLLITRENSENDAAFPEDELDPSSGRLILYSANGNLDTTTDPGFSVRTSNEALMLLAPGLTDDFIDDLAIDFIAEGVAVTPETSGAAVHGVVFSPPFTGIGNDDGAIFTTDPQGGLINDDGSDTGLPDATPGAGGWIVDPPREWTGDSLGSENLLTPGAPNTGQILRGIAGTGVVLY